MEQLAEFEYVQELGSGEFGRVFLCRSVLTGELRAVKHIVLDDDAGIADWRREAEALAACRNEHVVRIHHAAATADGPVLVMDLLPGGDAARRWLPGGGAVGDVVRTLIDATWGLHHLHTNGLLHRDLKPANLLFDAEGDRAPRSGVILELGVARCQASSEAVSEVSRTMVSSAMEPSAR